MVQRPEEQPSRIDNKEEVRPSHIHPAHDAAARHASKHLVRTIVGASIGSMVDLNRNQQSAGGSKTK
jgi:hypothetical protein